MLTLLGGPGLGIPRSLIGWPSDASHSPALTAPLRPAVFQPELEPETSERREADGGRKDETNAETCIEVQMRESRPRRWVCNAEVVRARKTPYLSCEY